MGIIYRTDSAVHPEDIHELFQTAVFSKGRNVEDIRHAIAGSSHLISAWDGNRLVGFARNIDDGRWYATIWDVMVHPKYRGQGIGSRIVELAVEPYRGQNYQFVALFAALGRVPFYVKRGFVSHPRAMVFASEYRGTPIDEEQ